ncbi:MAG: hypothetical protein CMF80_05840 [Candidatus Marinimicrobia bacterium]|nr:hypothetical protein [Candidatus Neomarinimicrobiota bacterium]|tara:strand:- start:162 stop:593 length:432 start_codon:yes stop_codon:yes gene_type:complete
MSYLYINTAEDKDFSNDPYTYLTSFNTQLTNLQSKISDISPYEDEDKKKQMNLQRAEQFKIKQHKLSMYNESLMYILASVVLIFFVLFLKTQFDLPNVLVICIIILIITIALTKCIINIAYANSTSDTKYGVFIWDYKSPEKE